MRKTLLLKCYELISVNKNYDIIDMALMDYMAGICASNNEKLHKIKVEKKIYTWVAYQKIIDDMPYIRIKNKEAISRRLKNLSDDKLLNKYIDKKNNSKTYFGIGEKWDHIQGVAPNDFKIGGVSTLKSSGVSTLKSTNISINNNNSIKDNHACVTIVDDSFKEFWDLYDKKIDRPKCEKKWQKLSAEDKIKIIAYLPGYIAATPEKQYRKHPATFLNNRSWENELISSGPGHALSMAEQAAADMGA